MKTGQVFRAKKPSFCIDRPEISSVSRHDALDHPESPCYTMDAVNKHFSENSNPHRTFDHRQKPKASRPETFKLFSKINEKKGNLKQQSSKSVTRTASKRIISTNRGSKKEKSPDSSVYRLPKFDQTGSRR